MKMLAAAAGAGFVVSELASTLLGWPGCLGVAAGHVHQALHPSRRLRPARPPVRLDLSFWAYYPVYESTALLLVVGLLAIGVPWCGVTGVAGILSIAIAATGLGAVVAHPIESQADRLMSPVWVLLALGLPLLFAARSQGSKDREPPLGSGSDAPRQEQNQESAFVSSDAA
jgi:hypothetical protein